jgi:hypothetical protein
MIRFHSFSYRCALRIFALRIRIAVICSSLEIGDCFCKVGWNSKTGRKTKAVSVFSFCVVFFGCETEIMGGAGVIGRAEVAGRKEIGVGELSFGVLGVGLLLKSGKIGGKRGAGH